MLAPAWLPLARAVMPASLPRCLESARINGCELLTLYSGVMIGSDGMVPALADETPSILVEACTLNPKTLHLCGELLWACKARFA